MIKIGVIGYTGRVNSLIIEQLKQENSFKLSGVLVRDKVDAQDTNFETYEKIDQLAAVSDAIIDFTSPATSLKIARELKDHKVLLVSGTTGFTLAEFEELKSYSKFYPLVWSANMSVGINILLSSIKKITPLLKDEFEAAIIETHHRYKKDSPSGTAKLLEAAIIEGGIKNVQMASLRIGEAKGEHIVSFANKNEEITLSHDVFSRDTFVRGALMACKWGIKKNSGLYSMQDVFGKL